MAAYGVPEADIARVVGIDAKTLRKHYREELDTGAVKATARVAEFLYRKATTEGAQCVTAAIFWLKTHGGWKETQVQEITGPPPRMVISWKPMSPEQKERLSRPVPAVIEHQSRVTATRVGLGLTSRRRFVSKALPESVYDRTIEEPTSAPRSPA